MPWRMIAAREHFIPFALTDFVACPTHVGQQFRHARIRDEHLVDGQRQVRNVVFLCNRFADMNDGLKREIFERIRLLKPFWKAGARRVLARVKDQAITFARLTP